MVKVKDKSVDLASGVFGEDNTIAFRISGNKFANDLVKSLDRPLVSTSANITAQASPYDMESIIKMFAKNPEPQGYRAKEPDLIIDGGTLPFHSPSTIVRITDDKVEVLRQGEIVINF